MKNAFEELAFFSHEVERLGVYPADPFRFRRPPTSRSRLGAKAVQPAWLAPAPRAPERSAGRARLAAPDGQRSSSRLSRLALPPTAAVLTLTVRSVAKRAR